MVEKRDSGPDDISDVTRSENYSQLIADRFLVQREIGSGGFGSVLLAIDNLLKRKVALKVLRPDPNKSPEEDEDRRRVLLEEARAAARLDHQNIVNIYDILESPDTLYIAMQFVEGETLKDRYVREGKCDPVKIGKGLLDLADALKYAHNHGVIHHDIKPANILINKQDRFILTDFGLAKVQQEGEAAASLNMRGTPSYMAPEKFMNTSVDARSDVFSFCCTLYEIFLGEKPFPGKSIGQVSYNIINQTPRVLLPECDVLPTAWKNFFLTGLAKDRESRLTAGNLVDVFGTLLQQVPSFDQESVLSSASEQECWVGAHETSADMTHEQVSEMILEESVRIDQLEQYLADIRTQCERERINTDRVIELTSLFITDSMSFMKKLESSLHSKSDGDEVYLLLCSLSFLCSELEKQLVEDRFSEEERTTLQGLRSQLHKKIYIWSLQLQDLAQEVSKDKSSSQEAFFQGFSDDSSPELTEEQKDWYDALIAADELSLYETITSLVGSGQANFLHELYSTTPEKRERIINLLWKSADILLLEGRASARPIFEAIIDQSCDDSACLKWKQLYTQFTRTEGNYLNPKLIRLIVQKQNYADQAVFGRSLLIHPWSEYRKIALEVLKPADYWHVISHHQTPVSFLLTIWQHLKNEVTSNYKKIYFMSVRDNLTTPGDASRVMAIVAMVKEFYTVNAFHEDTFFTMLQDLDQNVREEGRKHGLLVNLDDEYVNLFKRFIAGGPQPEQPSGEWSQVPLPVQRLLARKGYFLIYFVSHPNNTIALECLPHLLRRANVVEFIRLPSINALLLRELAKKKDLFYDEECKFALVANPKTPANIVLHHIHYLKSHSVKKLAKSKECNQMARTMARKLEEKRAGDRK